MQGRSIDNENEIPHEFYCPISQEIMNDPVVAADGMSYEKSEILKWLKYKDNSPLTGKKLKDKNVQENITLKKLIKDFFDKLENKKKKVLQDQLRKKELEKQKKIAQNSYKYNPEIVEVVQNKYMKNSIPSPFINQKKSWEDKEYNLPLDIKSNIINNLGFQKPSTIQSVSIPLIIQEPYNDLIAQARNGAGKTGSFVIGSILRLDRANSNTQVLVISHTRELCNQIYNVYCLLLKGLDISISNLMIQENTNSQIIVSTHEKIQLLLSSRKPINIPDLKCMIFDEADEFIFDERSFQCVQQIFNNQQIKNNRKKIQVILFSATYSDEDYNKFDQIQKRIATIIENAHQIRIKNSQALKLENIKQYFHYCDRGQKIDFIKSIFDACDQTHTFIFVNSAEYAEKLQWELKNSGFQSFILSSQMSESERDNTMQKFRNQEFNVLITTDLLSRGIDIPETDLVINFDVPFQRINNEIQAEPETYLHRIGRAGRFGRPGVALTIWDRPVDSQIFDLIVKHYDMGSVVTKFKGVDHLKQLIYDLNA